MSRCLSEGCISAVVSHIHNAEIFTSAESLSLASAVDRADRQRVWCPWLLSIYMQIHGAHSFACKRRGQVHSR